MKIFTFKDTEYIQIKEHSFQILNGFKIDYRKIAFIQCTTTTSSGIIKEYLPKGFELQKKRYNGQMIYNIYKKNLFKYNSKAESLGNTMFIGLSKDGALYLMLRWILTNRLNVDDTEQNIKLAKKHLVDSRKYDTFGNINSNGDFSAIAINPNNYSTEYAIDNLKEEIEKGN